MTTGVDAQTCKLIMLEKNLKSIINFKQVIGRGTRIDDYGKLWFKILDFKKTTELFVDESFDGISGYIMTVTPSKINERREELDEVVDCESGAGLDITSGTDLTYAYDGNNSFDLESNIINEIKVNE